MAIDVDREISLIKTNEINGRFYSATGNLGSINGCEQIHHSDGLSSLWLYDSNNNESSEATQAFPVVNEHNGGGVQRSNNYSHLIRNIWVSSYKDIYMDECGSSYWFY